jgi:hypothetical protein
MGALKHDPMGLKIFPVEAKLLAGLPLRYLLV